ncbi:MAG: hypothetical protein WD894_17120 [Pirellulales bacterium]
MNPRRGMSLLEVSVTITISTALLYGAVLLFASFQRIDRTARMRVEGAREVMRLAEQFRSDVYAAHRVEQNEGGEETAAEGPIITLDIGGMRRVEYRVAVDHQLARTVSVAEQISERDSYGVGPETVFSIDVVQQPAQFVTLILSMSPDTDAQTNVPRTERRITALVGRDHRYEQDSQEQNP